MTLDEKKLYADYIISGISQLASCKDYAVSARGLINSIPAEDLAEVIAGTTTSADDVTALKASLETIENA